MECSRICAAGVVCVAVTMLLTASSNAFIIKVSPPQSSVDSDSEVLRRVAREIGQISTFNHNSLTPCSRGEICGFDVISRETFEPLGVLSACRCKPGLKCSYTGEFNLATEVYNLRCKLDTETTTRPPPVTSLH